MTIYVNSKLKEFANFDPTKDSKQLKILEICTQIENGEMVLPIFQTYLRWSTKENISLYNYLLLGKAALSPISVNEIKEENVAVQQVTFINRDFVNAKKGMYSTTDGQQRCTCCYLAYINDEAVKVIVLDLTKGEFIENTGALTESQIPVGILYNKDMQVFKDFVEAREQLKDFEVYSLLVDIRSKFFNYYFSANFAKDLDAEEQIYWFNRLNLAGSRVTNIELQLTNLLPKGVDFYTLYANKFVSKLNSNGVKFSVLTTEVSIPLACLNSAYEIVTNRAHSSNYSPIPSDAKINQICKLENYDLEKCFDLTLKAIDNVFKFVNQNNLNHYISLRIDYITYLIGLFVYIGNSTINEKQKNAIIDWCKNVNFKNESNTARRAKFDKLLAIRNL